MTSIVVEDGTIVSGANSYVSLANATTYWGNWGYSLTNITTTQQTNALIQAAYALDKLFGRYYVGRVQHKSPQSLLWPRQFDPSTPYSVQVQDSTGSGAEFVVRVIDGSVSNVFIVNGGSNYTAPTLMLAGPDNIYGGTVTATVTAALTSGAISSVTITNAGQNYRSPREITANDYTNIAINEIPQQLQDAQCEIAWLALSGTNIFPQLSDEQKLKQERTQIGSINLINTYDNPFQLDGERLQGFRKVELVLGPVITTQHSFEL